MKIGGKPAKILYAGAVPYLVAGVMQVNAQLPDGLPSGQVPVVLMAGTRIGTATSEISIR